MSGSEEKIDLELFLEQQLLDRQNRLKAQVQEILESVSNGFSQKSLLEIHPQSKGLKISKGNNLHGSPYFVLDLIRDFDDELGINIRLLVWWGKGCFLMVFFGKKVPIPVDLLLKHNFRLGLTDDRWDFNDLIINQNQTQSVSLELIQSRDFILWINELELLENQDSNRELFITEIKKVLSILE